MRCGKTFAFATPNVDLFIISITVQCDAGKLSLLLSKFRPFYNLNCSAVLENVPPGAGLQKRANFSTLILGLDNPGIEPGPPAWFAAALNAQPSTATHCIAYWVKKKKKQKISK
jgi:hypothetical protein